MLLRNLARDKSGATTRGWSRPILLRRTRVSTSRTTCVVVAPRRLSRLFFSRASFLSLRDNRSAIARQMCPWQWAPGPSPFIKEGTRRTTAREGAREGTGGNEHGGRGFYKARRYRRFRVPHAPILQCTLLVCPLLFDCPAPFRLFSPCIWLALDSFPISSPATVLLLPSWSALFSLTIRRGAQGIGRQIDG